MESDNAEVHDAQLGRLDHYVHVHVHVAKLRAKVRAEVQPDAHAFARLRGGSKGHEAVRGVLIEIHRRVVHVRHWRAAVHEGVPLVVGREDFDVGDVGGKRAMRFLQIGFHLVNRKALKWVCLALLEPKVRLLGAEVGGRVSVGDGCLEIGAHDGSRHEVDLVRPEVVGSHGVGARLAGFRPRVVLRLPHQTLVRRSLKVTGLRVQCQPLNVAQPLDSGLVVLVNGDAAWRTAGGLQCVSG